MFSKLVFTVNGTSIDFHIHELVQLVTETIKDCRIEDISSIPYDTWNFIYDDIADLGTFIHALKDRTLDPILFVPPHIGNLDMPVKWYSVTHSLKQIPLNSLLLEWWFLISGRLIAVKNQSICDVYIFPNEQKESVGLEFIESIKDTAVVILAEKDGKIPIIIINDGNIINDTGVLSDSDANYRSFIIERAIKNRCKIKYNERNQLFIQAIIEDVKKQKLINLNSYRFYVTDHGFLSDIMNGVREILFETNWLNPHIALGILGIEKKISQFADNSPEDIQMRDALLDSMSTADLQEIKSFEPDKTEEQLLEIQQSLRDDDTHRSLEWRKHKQEIHFNAMVIREFIRLKGELRDFDVTIRSLYSPQAADVIIKKVVLASLAQQINRGVKTSMFRPVFAYGTDTHGDKYVTFSTRIEEYLARNPMASHISIVKMARNVLANRSIEGDDLAFLPNLMVAWFVAESVRNANSVLTNFMLLDMMENCLSLNKELKDNGISLYDWSNVLTYSTARKAALTATTPIVDGYGMLLKDYELGGIHPMAHHRSENQCRPLKPGVKLTVVQQKEGSLIAHWLYEYLLHFYPDIKVSLFSISETPLDTDIFYNEQDILSKLKQLNSELKRQESTIDALKKQGKDVKKCAEKKQVIELEIERLKLLEIEYKKNSQNKLILGNIIKRILCQRLNSVLNIRNTTPESSIRDLFKSLQTEQLSVAVQDSAEVRNKKDEHDEKVEYDKIKKSITTAANMTFIFSSPTTAFKTYFLERQKEGFQFSVTQQSEKFLLIELTALPAGIDLKVALAHLRELRILLKREIDKIGKTSLSRQVQKQGKIFITIEADKDIIIKVVELLRNTGNHIESNLSSSICRIS